MPYVAVLILITVLTVLWFLWIHAKPKRPPLPPGPWGLPIVGNLPFLKPDLQIYFLDLAKKYGPIFKLRLGSKIAIVASSPEVTREILKTHDVTFANRDVPVAGQIASYGGVNIAWSPYGPEWRMLRKVCVHKLLSHATLDAFYSLRRCETRQTVGYLSEQARVGSPVNIGEQIFVTLLNVITQMLWGATVMGREREIVASEFKELVSEIVDILGRPNISDLFPILRRFDLQGMGKRMRGLVQRLDRIFDRVIDQRLKLDRQSQADGEDFLQFLLKLKDEDETTPLSMNNVKALLMDMVIAGTETSSCTIEFAIAELLSKPELMKRVQQELDEVVGKDKIVEESDITKLPYLLAVVKETLRLHPPGPFLVPHRPSQTTVVGGYTIPKDSQVFINVWAIHRDPTLWENPLEFDPDRFIYKSYDFSGNDFSYLPFGSGRRMCVGIVMAERTVLYNLATLLHSFHWKLPEGQRLEIEEKCGIALTLKNSLVLIPVLRLSDFSLYL